MTDILVGVCVCVCVCVGCQVAGLTSTHVSAQNQQHDPKVQLKRRALTANNPRTSAQLTIPQCRTGLTDLLLTRKRHMQRRQ